jgi:hypothetical protein
MTEERRRWLEFYAQVHAIEVALSFLRIQILRPMEFHWACKHPRDFKKYRLQLKARNLIRHDRYLLRAAQIALENADESQESPATR